MQTFLCLIYCTVSSARTRDKQKAAAEEEELRRLERNRVAFEAWLQRKKEQREVVPIIQNMPFLLQLQALRYKHQTLVVWKIHPS